MTRWLGVDDAIHGSDRIYEAHEVHETLSIHLSHTASSFAEFGILFLHAQPLLSRNEIFHTSVSKVGPNSV
jgi:cellobiose-specific phosphotransferase system component IIA